MMIVVRWVEKLLCAAHPFLFIFLHPSWMSSCVCSCACFVQVPLEKMQARLSCAARHFSWVEGTGRAVQVLACALTQHKHGAEVVPTMDWDACKLHCDPPP